MQEPDALAWETASFSHGQDRQLMRAVICTGGRHYQAERGQPLADILACRGEHPATAGPLTDEIRTLLSYDDMMRLHLGYKVPPGYILARLRRYGEASVHHQGELLEARPAHTLLIPAGDFHITTFWPALGKQPIRRLIYNQAGRGFVARLGRAGRQSGITALSHYLVGDTYPGQVYFAELETLLRHLDQLNGEPPSAEVAATAAEVRRMVLELLHRTVRPGHTPGVRPALNDARLTLERLRYQLAGEDDLQNQADSAVVQERLKQLGQE